MTTAPSMMIPKSIAPIESRLAVMPFIRIQKKANSNDNGIIIDTMTVVRQSNINMRYDHRDQSIPSRRLCNTV
jgi:hypothetical protein